MFQEHGCAESILNEMDAHFRKWLPPQIAAGAYLGFIHRTAGVESHAAGSRTQFYMPLRKDVPLYETTGWTATTEMGKSLPSHRLTLPRRLFLS